jgi:hypothetical protein
MWCAKYLMCVDEETYTRYLDELSGEDRHFLEELRPWFLSDEKQVVCDKQTSTNINTQTNNDTLSFLCAHTNAFAVQILGGRESKKEWILKALERRLEMEKKNTKLRLLKLESFDFFCREFRYGGKEEVVEPVYMKFATLMRDLIALNCWSTLIVDTDLPCECYASFSQWFRLSDSSPFSFKTGADTIFSNISQCTNLLQFQGRMKMSPATIAQYSILLANPACALKEVHLSSHMCNSFACCELYYINS